MNGKALVPIVLVVLVILTLAPGPILAAESKKQDAPGDFDQRFAEGVRLHDAGQYDAAIAGLQEEPAHPGSWRALGVALQMAGQRARAFVAFARFLTLEPDSQRSPAAASSLWNLLFEGVKSTPKEEGGKPGDVSITVPPPKEGDDPATAEGLTISMVAASRYLEEWKDKSDAQFFAHAFDEVLAILTELDESAKTKDPFWSVLALPYFREAREAGHLEAMAYSVRRSLKEPDTLSWLADHAEAVDHYRAWSKAWKPAAPTASS